MSKHSACRLLPYAQHLVRLAVCDVLEQEGCLNFVRDGPDGAIQADVTVYNNPGRFSIAVRDGPGFGHVVGNLYGRGNGGLPRAPGLVEGRRGPPVETIVR